MRVLVPAATRREDQIAVFHHHFLAVDVGVGAVTLEDEAKRRHRVPMRRRDFAGLDQLKRKQDGVTGHLRFGYPWIHETDDPSLDTASGYGNSLTRLEQAVVNIVPLPKVRLNPCLWIGWALRMIEIPQTGYPAWTEQIIQFLNFFGQFHRASWQGGGSNCSNSSSRSNRF